MNSSAKVLIPNKEWIIKDNFGKIASVAKNKKGYMVIRKGYIHPFKNLTDINEELGVNIIEENLKKKQADNKELSIYDYPCSSKPYQPIYNVRKKLPLFAKSDKSKSQYCAGYYVIKFRKGWVKSFCPKLITLERYPFFGPYKTENEMKLTLKTLNKNDSTS